MPHASLKLIPGVDTTKTPALNEAAVSQSDLVRFVPDRSGLGMVQKLGGWSRFYPNQTASPPRVLHAWQDTNAKTWLGVGAQESLSVINAGNLLDVTPQTRVTSPAVSLSTVAGSPLVTITDPGSSIDIYDTVFIATQIAVGGLVLFGLYPCQPLSPDSYQVVARNVLDEPVAATSTATNSGATPLFATTPGSSIVTVTLAGHGLSPGASFAILIPTSVGGVVLSENYTVKTVVSSSQFTLQASNEATASATASLNGGLASYRYFDGVGPLPQGTGYGVLGFGVGGYGTGVPLGPSPASAIDPVSDWTLDNWGETLIACPKGGPLFAWTPTANDPAAIALPFGPSASAGAFVAMPQRQIVAWGSTFNGVQDPLLIRWCDVGDYDVWAGKITNQAGSFRIPKGSKIVQCIQGPQQGLVWTDIGVWSMQYTGPPFVYSFNELGAGCGLIGQKAAAAVNNVVYWMGQSQFFRLSGSGVEPLPCPVWDIAFQQIDKDFTDRIRVAPNSRFGEIAWFFPTLGSGGEPTTYVKYNFLLDAWDYGSLCRTAWLNESVLGPPIAACGLSRYIFQHETSPDADGRPMQSFFQTGYFVLSEATEKLFVDQVWPDFKWREASGGANAELALTFYVADYAGSPARAYGPFTLTEAVEYVTPRFRGRLVSIRVESSDPGSFWRVGNTRYRFQSDGRF
jgi:hypothetical protein